MGATKLTPFSRLDKENRDLIKMNETDTQRKNE